MRVLPKEIIGATILGVLLGGAIAVGSSVGFAAAASVAVLPIVILALPACIAQALGHLTRLVREFDFSLAPWILLFLSGLVFRTRDSHSIQEVPLDAWALFRIGSVGLAFLIVASSYFWGTRSLHSYCRGLPGILMVWALIEVASTVWSAFPSWTLYKSLEWAVDLAVLGSLISVVNTVQDCKRVFDWTWILHFGLVSSVWLGAVIWPAETVERGVGILGLQLSGIFPLVSSNGLGELAGLLGIVCLVRLVYSAHKICYSVVFVCCFVTMILAQTRSALLGFVGGALSILIATRRYFSALVTVAIAFLVLSTSSSDTFWEYFRRGQDTVLLSNLSGRTEWWAAAIQKIKERPVLGYGAYSGGRFVVLQQFNPDISSVHNDYLEIALGTGLIGLSLVAAALAGVWAKVLRAAQKGAQSGLERELTVEALAVLTLLTIRSMFSPALFWHPPLPFLLVLGYAEILRRRSIQRFVTAQYFTATWRLRRATSSARERLDPAPP